MHFSVASSPNLILTLLKSASKRLIERFVQFGGHKVVTKGHNIPENQHIVCCYYHFMLLKQRFWNVGKYVGETFCKHFSSLLAQIEYSGVCELLIDF